jgi:non-specific serine/threonine protein kinase/serine/threonine-protein kinase
MGDQNTSADSTISSTGADASAISPHGLTIGPYRLVRQIGEGGMGEVWLAEQVKPVRRDVALKVIKTGMDTAQVVARFNAERQALAVMDHPAIAHVFDGGATPTGRPYFVMEYVRGEPLTDYAERHKLSIRDRIDLFIHLCEGVQHAHQKGIIHRDLKPSNVLVTLQDQRPVPKIIDFGVAKATTRVLTEQPMHTEFGAIIGTPEYMSPEQAEMTGLDVDTRTDVYALGVILYQLLTSELPFESSTLRAKGLDEIRRTIREVEPPRPSTRVTTHGGKHGSAAGVRPDAPRLASQLRGDLDWITMKALEKDRTRRYATASEFAADLRRYLEHQPVLAGPPSKVYRLRKFVRRNRVGVASAAALAMFLVAFAVLMAVQAQRIASERDRANREAQRANREAVTARQVSDFLIGLFAVSDPSEARGNTLTAREILDKGAAQIQLELQDQPEVQAPLMETIGAVYTNLGLYRTAEPLLQQAVVTAQQALGDDDTRTLAARNHLATLYWYQQRFSEAEPIYEDVLRRRTRVLGADHPDTLRTQVDLSSNFAMQKRYADAERLARETLDAAVRSGGPEHPNARLARNILQAVYFQQGRYADAEPIARQILESSLRRLGERHPDTLTDMHNLATVIDRQARFDEAESLYVRTIELKERVLGVTHPSTVRSAQRLATMYATQKRYDRAETQLIDLVARLRKAGDSGTDVAASLASVVQQLIGLYDAAGRPDKAKQLRSTPPVP